MSTRHQKRILRATARQILTKIRALSSTATAGAILAMLEERAQSYGHSAAALFLLGALLNVPPGELAMLRAGLAEEPIRDGVDRGASEKTERSRVEPAKAMMPAIIRWLTLS